jgi:Icc-related predicted phosphoesterase
MRDGGGSLVASLTKDVDVLVAAGDIAVGEGLPGAIRLLCRNFKHVVFLSGNHEYYGATRERVRSLLERATLDHENFHLLTSDEGAEGTVWIDRQRFIGDTLWFQRHPTAPKHDLNDFRVIKNFESWVYDENLQTKIFLDTFMRPSDIVVTHHLPSYKSVAEEYRSSPLNPFFVCDVERLIREKKPKLWLHGHTHASCDYTIDHDDGTTTRVACNPFGYPHERNPDFDPNLVIDTEAL